jgi:hypothetical protein|tara:strand:- start:12 stop:1019 length:1008 start_codon:yes stop_codon:yes gene_type:complete
MLLGSSQPVTLEDNSMVKPCDSSNIQIQDKIVIDRTPNPPVHPVTLPVHSNILAMRFRKALKTNKITVLQRCLESGYIPSDSQWLTIISRLHVNSALNCLHLARTLSTKCVTVAIRRQHKKLFKEVVTRVDIIPQSQIDVLMSVPAYYLEVCLNRGLDPNLKLKNHRLPLEHACAHSRIAHIEILLNDTRTTVSQNVCRFMIRQTKQQKFAEKAIELCENIVPDMILEAIVANVTSALCSIMSKLETNYEDRPEWNEITHMLRCPISHDYSADLVKTPINNHYYDRVQLLTWVRSKGTDPMTRAPLQESDLLLRSEFLSEYAKSLQQKIQELDKK